MGTLAEGTGVLQAPSDADLIFDVNRPGNGSRNLQFSMGDAGRELCVFAEMVLFDPVHGLVQECEDIRVLPTPMHRVIPVSRGFHAHHVSISGAFGARANTQPSTRWATRPCTIYMHLGTAHVAY
jgi:hypothetical protein